MENPVLDLLLKGGHVIDPANAIDGPMDVGITAGKIARVAVSIPSAEAKQVVDVSGLIVTPGILDIHTHVYLFRPKGTNYVEGVHGDAHLFSSGVTTTVDVGTAGWKDFPDFKEAFIDRAKVRILAMINIASGGMTNAVSEQTEADMQPEIAASLAKAFPEIIVGIKTAHYWTALPWDDSHHPWSSVERAVEAGEMCGMPVMVDFWPRPPERSYPDLLLKKLRPGDIHTHCFAQQFPILAEQNRKNPGYAKVNDFMFEARERGIIFDLGHGAGSFWFRNAVPAFRGGFPPDSLSTDLHMGNINGPVVGMANTMSKFINMGMPLQEVIRRSTCQPALEIRRPELGTLRVGAEADVAVFQQREGSFSFADCGKAKLSGSKKLECQLTLRAGEVVWDPYGLSMPEWEEAPPSYWELHH
jgi:dihydroorotase